MASLGGGGEGVGSGLWDPVLCRESRFQAGSGVPDPDSRL